MKIKLLILISLLIIVYIKPFSQLFKATRLKGNIALNNQYDDCYEHIPTPSNLFAEKSERGNPKIPAKGAYYSNSYRNMFVEAGYKKEEVNLKMEKIWNQLFYGNPVQQAVYYPVGTDEAYILDTGNDDVRSEGMSYGMMICVQMDKKDEFNRLWKWTKTYMQHKTGSREGYFAWQLNKNGSIIDPNTASDGEEYFVMALMFAAHRWGNGEGIFNYWKEANDILKLTMNKKDDSPEPVKNLFSAVHKQVVFVPYSNAANYTDPSYHLPAFYYLWSLWANENREFWGQAAIKSREMFQKFAHHQTGLMPDYANFDGTPKAVGNHADFRFDAWRCIMNIAMDYAWFKPNKNQVELVKRVHSFFNSEGINSYGNQYTLSGIRLGSDHSPGLVSCNAAGAMASDDPMAWKFIDDFFNTPIPSGKYRYYDGLLYFMNYLHLSGNFKIYKPDTSPRKIKQRN